MSKEDYDFCKSSHICVRCRKERATPGRTTCLACRMAERERHARDYAKHRDEFLRKAAEPGGRNEKNRELYRQRKEQGLCTACGKINNTKRNTCPRCAAKDRAFQEKYRKIRNLGKPIWGIERCHFCLKPPEKGYKCCAEHLAKLKEIAAKGRESRKLKNHYWSKLIRADVLESKLCITRTKTEP